jgi:uncharacterized protein (DUF58 family)
VDLVLLATVAIVGVQLKKVRVTVSHEWPSRIQMDRSIDLIYRIENRGNSRAVVKLRQLWPESIEAAADTTDVLVNGGEIVRVSLQAMAHARGTIPSSTTEVEIRFTADIARRRWQTDSPELLACPSLQNVANFERLERSRAAAQAGIHQLRTIGSGREFDQLRDYVPDDEYRDINWKATAHHSRPITNMYRAERSQEIMLCLDAGRMMGSPMGSRTVLDHAVDAAVMLAHVANRQSDRVGLVLFRDVVERFIKPVGGRQKRRSMVFLFTDLNDPQLASNMAEVLPLVSRRHVITVVNLRDPLLENVASGPASESRDVFRVVAARELANERSEHTLSLIRAGIRVLEADADSLTLKLINTYLKLKSRQVL